jgi:hypothetical protein
MVTLADAERVQIAGEAFDLSQGLRKGPALAALKRREDLIWLIASVALRA